MKKWLIGSLILVALMFVFAGVHAQTQDKEKGKDKAKTECKAFVDENKDGICDNHGTDKCMHSEGCRSKCEDRKEDAKCTESCKQKEAGCCAKKDTVTVAP
jgi:hypothetical protein